ncbi:MAG: Mycothiol conjugate amidase Mca [Acidimicrobiaceae bacterium]|jgi:mycothiol S-conjugate amidase|nr:Mycothiol conjugate amidase Mca [Acidimicrobiaceae bacterium]
MPASLCLLTVHAHPDDEASKGAGTVARYHAEGVRTVLVTCTGGEEGEILNPAMDTPEVRDDIAAVRKLELDVAAAAIGYDVVEMLGYRDSGMPDSPANADPRSFARAPLDEAVGRLVRIVRRERPQVLVAYGEDQSSYPHPDHLRAHEIAVAAFDAAADPAAFTDSGEPFQPLKLYYVGWSREQALARHEKFLELGLISPYAERIAEGWLQRMPDVHPTTSVDLTGFEHIRQAGLLAHATQVDPTSPFWFGLPDEAERAIYTHDYYVLARTLVDTALPEQDLFSGVRELASRSSGD